MEQLTLHRYSIFGRNWDETFDQTAYADIIKEMNGLPFQGETEEDLYGFARCARINNVIFGLFIQKHPQKIVDYDSQTKMENIQLMVDSGEYLFVIFPNRLEIFFQHKRSSDLPSTNEILQRFEGVLKLVFSKTKYMFSELKAVKEDVDREKIIDIFYHQSDEVLEMEFSEFDPSLIAFEKTKRGGKIQTYFNPREQYQEAMEEAAIVLATNTERASIKAKKGSNLKKDPITRAMLEGSGAPTKIVYKRENTEYTEYGITKSKEIITIENPDMIENIENIIDKLSNIGVTHTQKEKGKGTLPMFSN